MLHCYFSYLQDVLQDRREVYRLLQENGIAVPMHIVVNRDGLEAGEDPVGFIEEEDYVELDGVRIDKPFVEKPASGEDHNIHIYYPHSMVSATQHTHLLL
jgi:inositol hexakisphosphate/diphosphoinositol-pentakisphosphate kinase